ncbi:MAG: hypothetical protein IPL35_00235 [Sphingobacteriales bacterium]|nr:hypothetical protein [Sphingobacteriales bacterium]
MAANLAVTTNVTNTNSTEQAGLLLLPIPLQIASNTVIYAAENLLI